MRSEMKNSPIVFAMLAALLCAAPGAAQEPVLVPDTVRVPAAVPDTLPPTNEIPRERPSPRAAFVRALVVPGWGHFGMGEYRRGAVYAGLQGASWFMLGKTLNRLADVRDTERSLSALARDSIIGVIGADSADVLRTTNPQAWDSALVTFPGLRDARTLQRARERHRQDWIVYTVVLTFAASIDAYVTAHLREFPAEVTTRPARDGGTEIGVRVPLPARR